MLGKVGGRERHLGPLWSKALLWASSGESLTLGSGMTRRRWKGGWHKCLDLRNKDHVDESARAFAYFALMPSSLLFLHSP